MYWDTAIYSLAPFGTSDASIRFGLGLPSLLFYNLTTGPREKLLASFSELNFRKAPAEDGW